MGQWNEVCQTALAHFSFTFPIKDFKVNNADTDLA